MAMVFFMRNEVIMVSLLLYQGDNCFFCAGNEYNNDPFSQSQVIKA
jgi:hypothetical protein